MEEKKVYSKTAIVVFILGLSFPLFSGIFYLFLYFIDKFLSKGVDFFSPKIPLLFCFISFLIILILTIIANIHISSSSQKLKGRGFSLWGLIFLIIWCVIFFLPALGYCIPCAYRNECEDKLVNLRDLFHKYADANGDQWPEKEVWCDILKNEYGLRKKDFRCRNDQVGPCSYALNINLPQSRADTPDDMVLFFESQPGWNQVEDRLLINLSNHTDSASLGCNIVRIDGKVDYIHDGWISELRWKVQDEARYPDWEK